jgi:hypothetical protein
MSTAIEILGYGGAVPAGVALVIAVLCRRLLPPTASERYAAAAAVASTFFIAYALLPWTELQPKRHWQWLPYLGAAAMIAGPLALASGVSRVERWLVHLMLALTAAWLLVPAWSTLEPPRPAYIAMLTGYLLLLMTALDALPPRLLGPLFLVHLTIAAAATALALAVSVSVKFGQLAGIATAAMAGCAVSAFFSRPHSAAQGSIPVFAILLGGSAFVGCIELQPPLAGILLAPAAPLALWICARGPLTRFEGVRGAAVQIAAVLIPLTIALLWTLRGRP